MKRFDVCPTSRDAKAQHRLVVVLQHEVLDELTTTIVAPLFKPSEYRVVRALTPIVTVKSRSMVVAIDRIAAVPKAQLGKAVGNLEPARFELLRAIDFLFSGF